MKSLVTPDRLENLRNAIKLTIGVPGDMAELGVYEGGSAAVMAEIKPDTTLHLFDTFEGIPCDEAPEYDPEGYVKKGMFACPIRKVRANLSGLPVYFYRGVFPQTTKGLDGLRFSFVHVDCDLYQSAKDAIEWFWPRLNPGGIMYFDDYGCKFTGVTRAVDEAFDAVTLQHDVHGYQIGCWIQK